MLKLLLDEHISPRVAKGLRQHNPGIVVFSMKEWEQGAFLGQTDALFLQVAAVQNLTLVTYDCRTIPSLLKMIAEQGRSHAGVIFVDEKTIAACHIGALVRALTTLFQEQQRWNWTNRVQFLR